MTRWWALVALLGAACGVREPGLEVTVTARVTPLTGVTLSAATLGLEEVALVPCPVVARPWWQVLSPVSSAWAHGGESTSEDPRVSRAPVLLDLGGDVQQVVATVTPPPGEVCGLTLTFAPSTADAPSQGTTLLLEGPGFRQLSTRRQVVSRTFAARPLDEAHRTLGLELRLVGGVPGVDGDSTLGQVLGSVRVQ